MSASSIQNEQPSFSAADISALAHLYRGEVYRSTVWRTRLDTTTNWAVLTTGIALSLTFSNPYASPLPLQLVGLLVAVFLYIEARRYRYFDFWRIRAHVLELYFFGPILLGHGVQFDRDWNEILYQDYRAPNLHITFMEALGRRLRHNYGWIFLIQVTTYTAKLLVHPSAIMSLDELWMRASVGPVHGQVVLFVGLVFHAAWVTLAIATSRSNRGAGRTRPLEPGKDRLLELARAQGATRAEKITDSR
jgi:uncharacterized membrane protein